MQAGKGDGNRNACLSALEDSAKSSTSPITDSANKADRRLQRFHRRSISSERGQRGNVGRQICDSQELDSPENPGRSNRGPRGGSAGANAPTWKADRIHPRPAEAGSTRRAGRHNGAGTAVSTGDEQRRPPPTSCTREDEPQPSAQSSCATLRPACGDDSERGRTCGPEHLARQSRSGRPVPETRHIRPVLH